MIFEGGSRSRFLNILARFLDSMNWSVLLSMLSLLCPAPYTWSFHVRFTASRSLGFIALASANNGFGHQPPKGFFKEQGGPSIDELAKKQRLRNLKNQYSSTTDKKVFQDVLEFPVEFTLKIIGFNDPTFLADMLEAIGKCITQPPSSIKYSTRPSGAYLSITVTPLFTSSAELYATYEAVGKDTRVKFVI
jgi:putative lipoic acid-binding regulatory protein